jgi:hypothetical protein
MSANLQDSQRQIIRLLAVALRAQEQGDSELVHLLAARAARCLEAGALGQTPPTPDRNQQAAERDQSEAKGQTR